MFRGLINLNNEIDIARAGVTQVNFGNSADKAGIGPDTSVSQLAPMFRDSQTLNFSLMELAEQEENGAKLQENKKTGSVLDNKS